MRIHLLEYCAQLENLLSKAQERVVRAVAAANEAKKIIVKSKKEPHTPAQCNNALTQVLSYVYAL